MAAGPAGRSSCWSTHSSCYTFNHRRQSASTGGQQVKRCVLLTARYKRRITAKRWRVVCGLRTNQNTKSSIRDRQSHSRSIQLLTLQSARHTSDRLTLRLPPGGFKPISAGIIVWFTVKVGVPFWGTLGINGLKDVGPSGCPYYLLLLIFIVQQQEQQCQRIDRN